jgi:hypothetical protein
LIVIVKQVLRSCRFLGQRIRTMLCVSPVCGWSTIKFPLATISQCQTRPCHLLTYIIHVLKAATRQSNLYCNTLSIVYMYSPPYLYCNILSILYMCSHPYLYCNTLSILYMYSHRPHVCMQYMSAKPSFLQMTARSTGSEQSRLSTHAVPA